MPKFLLPTTHLFFFRRSRDPKSKSREAWQSAANAADEAAKTEMWEEVLRWGCFFVGRGGWRGGWVFVYGFKLSKKLGELSFLFYGLINCEIF